MFLSPLKEKIFVTQKFGQRPDVYRQFGLKGHNGVDIRAKTGTELFAPIDGVVELINQGNVGYGMAVRIRNTYYDTIIAHMSAFNVKTGQVVKYGHPIGLSGNTGFSSGPHVHWGVRKLDFDGGIMDENNGYSGYLDHLPYVIEGWSVYQIK